MVKRKNEFPTVTMAQCRVVEEKVLEIWERRRKAQGYPVDPKHKSLFKETIKLQAEFMIGMAATLDVLLCPEEGGQSSISPKVLFSIMRGGYIE